DVVPVADFQAIHAVDRYWLVAEALGAAGRPRFHVHVPAEARRWAGELLPGRAPPGLGGGPGARWGTQRRPPAPLAPRRRAAQERFGGTALFVGGADETPLARAAAAGLDGPAVDLTGRTTLPQLAALLERVDVMVANDTGPLHLAAALGRPVVAPYTCTKAGM